MKFLSRTIRKINLGCGSFASLLEIAKPDGKPVRFVIYCFLYEKGVPIITKVAIFKPEEKILAVNAWPFGTGKEPKRHEWLSVKGAIVWLHGAASFPGGTMVRIKIDSPLAFH